MKHSKSKALTRFLISALIIYILWYLVYELWLHPWKKLDLLVINNLIFFSSSILKLFNFSLIDFPYDKDIRTLGIDGSHGVWIGDPCNGITLFALFSGFIIAYPGTIKWKLVYIPVGLITIHFLNILRVTALSIIAFYSPGSLDFNHTYTFTLLVYVYIFILWYFWASKFSGLRNKISHKVI